MKNSLPGLLGMAAAASALSLLIYLASVYLREARVAFFTSTLQRVTLTSLLLASLLPLIAALLLVRKPEMKQRWEARLQDLFQVAWLRQGTLFLAGLGLLICTIPLFNLLGPQSDRFAALLSRSAWLIFWLIALISLVLRSPYLWPLPRRWWAGLGWTALLFGASLALQAALFTRLENAPTASSLSAFATQAGWLLVIWSLVVWLSYMPAAERGAWILVCVMTAGLFTLQWLTLARKLAFLLPGMAAFAPFLIFGLPLLAAVALKAWDTLLARTGGKADWVLKAGLLVLAGALLVIYYRAALTHAQVINISTSFSDQAAYMKFIQRAQELNFRYTGDHNRMPLYPFFQALFYDPEMSDQALFEEGKQINILLSIALLAALFLILTRYLSFYQAYLLTLVVAFSLYIFKAPYIQAEISFYFVFFLCFLLISQMLLKPGLLLGALTGITLGVAYLTKGSVLPLVLLFIAIALLKEGWQYWQSTRQGQRSPLSALARNGAGYLLVVLAFWIFIFPYTSQMKQRFGAYFYNVNTSIYIWYDEMQQGYDGEARYHFAEGIPQDLPADQIPSLRKYLREHTPAQMLERFTNGVQSELRKIGWQFSVTNYQLAYLWIFALALLSHPRRVRQVLAQYPFVTLFGVLFFAGYLAAFAWYSPLASGRRFTYALYLPFLFSIFIALNVLAHRPSPASPGQRKVIDLARFTRAAHLVVATTLIYNIWLVVDFLLFIDRYGS